MIPKKPHILVCGSGANISEAVIAVLRRDTPLVVVADTKSTVNNEIEVVHPNGERESMTVEKLERIVNQRDHSTTELCQNSVLSDEDCETPRKDHNLPFYMNLNKYNRKRK